MVGGQQSVIMRYGAVKLCCNVASVINDGVVDGRGIESCGHSHTRKELEITVKNGVRVMSADIILIRRKTMHMLEALVKENAEGLRGGIAVQVSADYNGAVMLCHYRFYDL